MKKKIIIGIGIAIVVLGLCYYFVSDHRSPLAGSTTPSTSTAIYGTESIGSPLLILGGAATGPNSGSSIQEQTSIASCNTGTSTLFSVVNPFAATSTAVLQLISATGNATTSTLLVGTSTKATGLVATDVSPSFVNASIATSTSFQISGGITVGSAGYVSAGASTFRVIEVGGSDYIAAYATSTATGAGANGYSAGFTSCTYKIRWVN